METKPITEGTVLWEPSDEQISNANLTRYLNWLKTEKEINIKTIITTLLIEILKLFVLAILFIFICFKLSRNLCFSYLSTNLKQQ